MSRRWNDGVGRDPTFLALVCDYRWSFAGLDALVLLGKVMDPDPFGPCIDPLSGYWSQYVP